MYVKVFTDGAARGNPDGPGGYGAVIQYRDGTGKVYYVIKAFNEHWIEGWQRANWRKGRPNEVKNIDLWQRLLSVAAPHKITWNWVKGHAGHPENERCDRLATSAADGGNLQVDPGIK